MAAKLGEDPEALVADLAREVAQDLANGKPAEKVVEGLTKGGLPREQAAKLVGLVVQAMRRHENSAEGRAQKRSQAASQMMQGALWGAGGVAVTFLSMGSGRGRVFFGAVIYGAYLFLAGLVRWGGNRALPGDDEELKAAPGWLREIRVGEDVPDGAPATRPPPVSPRPIAPPAATPPRSASSPAVRRPARRSESTTITRLYAFAFLGDQMFGVALRFNILGRIGVSALVGPLYVLSVMTFAAGVLCAVHVLLDRLQYRFLILPAYHVLGVVLIYQLWRTPALMDGLYTAHAVVGLLGGLAWLRHARQLQRA